MWVQTWLKRLLALTLLALAAVVALAMYQGAFSAAGAARLLGQWTGLQGLPHARVAIIAGHRGHDSGAVCDTGLMEVDVTTEVAEKTVKRLRRQGVETLILDEYDPQLVGLQADALVSIHADSCIDLTGYKVASATQTILPAADARLVSCLEKEYAAATGMHTHPNTVTHDMTEYHAFQQVGEATPGAIIELGFLGGDGDLLANGRDRLAAGVANGVLCFLGGIG